MTRPSGEDGNALVEFTYLAVLLMVPLVYVLISAFQVQRASFGTSEAARQAGRAFATAPDETTARERALVAARLSLRDQGIDAEPDLDIRCQGPCLAPDSVVTISVRHVVRLPVLSLLGDSAPTIPVRATHDAVIDRFRGAP